MEKKIPIKKKSPGTTQLLLDDVYPAHITKAEEEARKFLLEFEVSYNGKPFLLSKEYPNILEPHNEGGRDFQVALGRPFSEDELSGGFDLSSLVRKNVRVVVIQKRTSGGRIHNGVTTILPPAPPPQNQASSSEPLKT